MVNPFFIFFLSHILVAILTYKRKKERNKKKNNKISALDRFNPNESLDELLAEPQEGQL